MGYYATGFGTATLLPGADIEKVREIINDDGGFSSISLNDDGSIDFEQYDKYYSEEVEDTLKKLSTYCRSGEIEFDGEDNCAWRFLFGNGSLTEENGHTVYDSEHEFYEKIVKSFVRVLSDICDPRERLEICLRLGLTAGDITRLGFGLVGPPDENR